jgi:hypothetical protein
VSRADEVGTKLPPPTRPEGAGRRKVPRLPTPGFWAGGQHLAATFPGCSAW